MRRTLFLIPLALTLAVLWGNGAEVNAACPTPAPTCTSSALGDFIGTFGCTIVSTRSDGSVHVSLAQVVSDGSGHITKFTTVDNSNTSGTTFTPWTSQFTNGTYCLNTDDTGYIFPPAAFGGCPFAIFIDISGFEVRLLDSTLNRAGAAVCELQ
jgi:hypothetical protein